MDYIKKIAWGLMAMAAVVGCNHENTEPEETGDGNHYMAVSLAMADGSGNATKADKPVFEDGSYEESAVNVANSIFLFYDGTGNYLTSGKIVATESDLDEKGNLKLSSSEFESVEKKSNAVIVMDKMPIRPSQVLAVLNYYGSIDDLKRKSLDEVDDMLVTDAISTDAGKFLMSNSVYVANGAIVRGTAISRDQVKNTAEEAIKTPVNIFVERAVAKIRMTSKDGLETVAADDCTDAEDVGKLCFDVTSATSILDGHFVDVRVVVDGWCVNAFNDRGYVLKTLDKKWVTTAPFDGWNIVNSEGQNTYYRSFWAKDANYDGTDDYVFGMSGEQHGTYANLKYRSWNEAVKAKKDTYTYLYENTVSKESCKANPGDKTNATTVLIAAHLEVRNSTKNNIVPPTTAAADAVGSNPWRRITLYKYDGLFYSKDNILTQIADLLSSSYKWKYDATDGTHVEDIKPAQLEVEFVSADNTNKSTVKITVKSLKKPNDNAKLYKNDVELTDASKWASDITTALANAYTDGMVTFTSGDCYYQVPVVHHKNADTLYGIVRNHIYNLTLNNITNIGNPVFNPDEKLIIIPGTREDYYVAAELRLLKWTVVSQDVNL